MVDYYFNRYYMDEFKAADAEKIYRESNRDTSKETYSLVNIKDGEAVLTDVVIDGISIKNIVENSIKNMKYFNSIMLRSGRLLIA